MEKLLIDDVSHLARLARLELSQEEQSRYADNLNSVVGYVSQLPEEKAIVKTGCASCPHHKQCVDQAQEEEILGFTGLRNVLAADLPREEDNLAAVDREHILGEAPKRQGDYFAVRAVMGEEGEEV